MMGKEGLSVKCTSILEHSKEMSKRVNWTWSCRDVNAKPLNVSHTIIVLSSLPETAVVPITIEWIFYVKGNGKQLREKCFSYHQQMSWHMWRSPSDLPKYVFLLPCGGPTQSNYNLLSRILLDFYWWQKRPPLKRHRNDRPAPVAEHRSWL